MPRSRLCLAACALAGACSAEAGGQIALPVVAGAEGGPDAVVGLLADGELFCSATMITRRVAVTAAHCVAMVPADARIEVFFGDRVDDGGERLPAAALLRHPDWSFDLLSFDIGVVALADDGPAAPIAVARRPLTGADVGSRVDIVGFGLATEQGDDAGRKRSGTVPVAAVEERRLIMGPGPPTTCSGDSGGPVLRPVDGELELIGVHSRSDCEFLSLAERVDVHAGGFIDPFVAEHPAECRDEPCDGGCAAAGGASWPPLAGLLLLLGRRRPQRASAGGSRSSRKNAARSPRPDTPALR